MIGHQYGSVYYMTVNGFWYLAIIIGLEILILSILNLILEFPYNNSPQKHQDKIMRQTS